MAVKLINLITREHANNGDFFILGIDMQDAHEDHSKWRGMAIFDEMIERTVHALNY